MKLRHSALIAASVAAILSAYSGQALAADVSGRVTEATTGRPLPSATVRIPELGLTTRADRSGAFRFTGLPAGQHTIEVDNVGFTRSSTVVTVSEAAPAVENVAMISADIEVVTVSGTRLAQATALQDKKTAKVIKESITANDAGKLPDQNAAETLVRVSGVSVTTDQGEGRYVTVRGIDAALNNVTIDSQIIGSPEGDTRRVALDTVPANLLSKLEVIKSVTPDLDGNAIGGTINLVTPSAFDDPDGSFFSATMEYGYYDLGGENPWGGSAAWGQVFGEDRFGIVLSASYSDREYTTHNLQGGDPWEEEGDYLVPDEMVLRDYNIQRERMGFVANLEFRPNDAMKFAWRNIYNRYEDIELQPEIVYDYRGGDLQDQTPTSGLFTEGEGERINSERREIQTILSSTLSGEWKLDDWKLSASGTYGETEQDTPYDNGYTFELGEEIPMTYDTSGYYWIVNAGPEFQDAGNFEFNEAARGGQLIEEELLIGQVDAQRDLFWGDAPGYLKFGAKLVNRDSTSDQDLTVYDGFDGDFLLSDVAQSGDPGFFTDVRRGYTFGPFPNYRASERFFRENEALFEVNDADTAAESFGVDYEVQEDVTAGYMMGSVDVGAATIVGGVRVERTEVDFTAYDVTFVDGDIDGTPPQVRGSKSYTNWLPGVQARWALQEDLILRAAWTNTIGRPSYEQNVPFRIFEIEEDDPGVFEGELEAGNADLDPLESMNYDASVEWYLEPAGILSGGIFYKDIDNPIFNRVQTLEDTEFEGRFYSELQITQPQNARSGNILGIELNYQQQFSMLPGLLRGLGVSLSYTWTDSEAEVFDRDEKVPFFLQSEHIGNAAVYYEFAGLELRLAYAYRSEYLDSIGDDESQDLYVDDHGQLDFKVRYAFTDSIDGFLQMQNLTEEPLVYFSGNDSRLAEYEFYSWSMMAGVTMKF
jgi:TonB-dependent receptor